MSLSHDITFLANKFLKEDAHGFLQPKIDERYKKKRGELISGYFTFVPFFGRKCVLQFGRVGV